MPRRRWILLSLWFCALACPCAAQDAPAEAGRRQPPQAAAAPGYTYSRTPEMMFYEQERERYESPKMMVRRRAELRGVQRAERLASLKWYGMNNSRPAMNPNPHWGGGFSPYWGSNTYDPNRWRPYYTPITMQGGVVRY